MIFYKNQKVQSKEALLALLKGDTSVSGIQVNSPYFTFLDQEVVYTLHLKVNGKYNKLAKDGKFIGK